jgi:hypothetical protein
MVSVPILEISSKLNFVSGAAFCIDFRDVQVSQPESMQPVSIYSDGPPPENMPSAELDLDEINGET